MGERSEDWIGGFWVVRIGHAGIEWTVTSEVKHILKCMAWRRAREGWREEDRASPKLEVMGRLMDCRCEARCVEVDCKSRGGC